MPVRATDGRVQENTQLYPFHACFLFFFNFFVNFFLSCFSCIAVGWLGGWSLVSILF